MENYSNDSIVLIINHWCQKEVGQCFSNAERIPVNLESYTQQKHSTVKKVKSKHSDEKKLRYASYRPPLKEKLKFTRQIETKKHINHQEVEKLCLNVRDFASPLWVC